MKRLIGLMVAVLVLSTAAIAQGFTCDPGWTQVTVSFKVGSGTGCCDASATACVRSNNGTLQVKIGPVSVDSACGDNLTLGVIRNAAFQTILQTNSAPMNQYTITPCATGYTYLNVERIDIECYTYFYERVPVIKNGVVVIETQKRFWNCGTTIVCEKSCSVCYGEDDPCNPGQKLLNVNCTTNYWPTESCPQGCTPSGCN